VVKAGKKHGKRLGRLVTDVGAGLAEVEEGWDTLCYHGDVWLLQVAIRQGIDGIRAGASRAKAKPAGKGKGRK